MEQTLTGLAQIYSKDIALLAFGAAISFLIRYVPAFISNYKKVTPLINEWHAYHWSRANGEPVFINTTYKIKRNIYGLRISVKDEAGSTLPYSGTVLFDGSDVVIEAKGINHPEQWSLRLNNPIPNPTPNTIMLGLSMGVDFDRNKYATIQLCTRKKISVDEAKKAITKAANIFPDEAALRVN